MSLYRSSCRHFCAWLLLCLSFFALVAASPAQAHDPSADPLSEVNFEQKLNEQIPLDLAFRDEAGQTVQLGDYFGEKPVILVFAYYGCKTLCSVVLEELVETLRALKFDVGNQFKVVTVSIDPRDKPMLAAKKKASSLSTMGVPAQPLAGASSPATTPPSTHWPKPLASVTPMMLNSINMPTQPVL